MRLTLTFAMTECRRCHAQRQAQQPCAECGAQPTTPEADPMVQRRRRIIKELEGSDREIEHIDLDPIEMFERSDLEGLVGRMWAALCSVLASAEAGDDRLNQVTIELLTLERWAAETPRLRPLIALADEMTSTIDGFRALYDSGLEAVRAETIAQAQEVEPRLQAALDSITDRVVAMGATTATLRTILEAEDSTGAVLGLVLAGDFTSVGQEADELLRARLGVTDTESTAGLLALVGDALARAIGNPTTFWTIAEGHLDLLRSCSAELTDILTSDQFARRQTEVAHDGLSAARRGARMPSQLLTDREQLTDLLEAGHLTIEQPLKLHLGLACAATTRRDFAASQEADVSELAQIATDKRWAVAPHLPGSSIRNAFAHRSYSIEGGIAVFPGVRGGPDVRIHPRDLQNSVLAATEASMAMDLALAIVEAEAGISVPTELPAVWLAEAFMVALGWTGVAVEVADRIAHAEATLAADAPLASMAFVAQSLVGVAKTLDLVLHGTTGTVRILGSLDTMSDWGEITDAVEKSARFVQQLRLTTRDGQPLITEDAATKALAVQAMEIAVQSDRSVLATTTDLRTIRSVARDLHFQELTRMLGRLIQWRATVGSDVAVSHDEVAGLFDLMNRPVEQPSGMLLT